MVFSAWTLFGVTSRLKASLIYQMQVYPIHLIIIIIIIIIRNVTSPALEFLTVLLLFLTREYAKCNEQVIRMDGNFTRSLDPSLRCKLPFLDNSADQCIRLS